MIVWLRLKWQTNQMTAWRDEPNDQNASSVSQPMVLTLFKRPIMSFKGSCMFPLYGTYTISLLHDRDVSRTFSGETCHLSSASQINRNHMIAQWSCWNYTIATEHYHAHDEKRSRWNLRSKCQWQPHSDTFTVIQYWYLARIAMSGGGLVGPQVFHPIIFRILSCLFVF